VSPDVALISPYPRIGTRHGGASGVASYTANLAAALHAIGLEPVVVAPFEPGEPPSADDGGVRVLRAFPAGRAGTAAQALEAARRTGAPVVHLQFELFLFGGPATLAGLGPALRRHRPVPTVLTMHQVVDPATVDAGFTAMHRIGVPAPVARTALATVQRGLPRLVDSTIVHEPAFARAVPGARVVPHGVEPGETVQPAARAASRRRLELPQEKLVALCFGFVAPYKGLETAFDAAALAGEDVQLVVAGGDHPRLAARGDGYAAALRARYGDVARFPGFVDGPDVADWFRAADVALFPYPSPHAASGALALALAYRRPVLLSPRLAAAGGADPRLVCACEPVALAGRLRRLAADPAARAELQELAGALADGRSWPATALAHQTIYEEVSDVPSTPRRRLRAA
jgi:glycosyltransferase involved in cell wall biosynthesis